MKYQIQGSITPRSQDAARHLLGLLPSIMKLDDPVSAALLDETRAKRARRKSAAADLDF